MLSQFRHKHPLIVAFLAELDLAHFWTESGPSIKAQQILSGHASSEPWVRTCIGLAFDFSDGSANVTVNQICETLDGTQVELIFLLLARFAHGQAGAESMFKGGGDVEN